MMSTSIHEEGPIFDGRAEKMLHKACERAEEEVAEHAENRVHQRLRQVLRHPTGYYESRVQTDNTVQGHEVIGDNVIYGPWLEGVGERNQTTRFKGYATFRTVAQEVDSVAPRMVENEIDKEVPKL